MKIRNCAILLFFLISSFPHFLIAQTTSSKDIPATLKLLYLGGKYDSAAVISEKYINDFNLKNEPDFWYFSGLVFKEMYKKYEKGNRRKNKETNNLKRKLSPFNQKKKNRK